MGIYLNSKKATRLYKSEYDSDYFVDKSAMLKELIPLVEEGNRFVCVTRPRRFGKTVAANMISAFFGKGTDSRGIFSQLKIADDIGYEKHMNAHNLIYITFNEVPKDCSSYEEYIGRIQRILAADLKAAFPDCYIDEKDALWDILNRIYEMNKTQFIFVFDEWDFIFRRNFVTDKDKVEYISFLNNLLKDRPYVSFAYMTGVLPIARYSNGSQLSMFTEYTMASDGKYSSYFGFTESEMDNLYDRYLKLTEKPKITRDELRIWSNGYHTETGEQLYIPSSVVLPLRDNDIESYWIGA